MTIDDICKKYKITDYIINPDKTIDVDVDGDVTLSFSYLSKLPLKFNKVSGNFLYNNNLLTNLIGSPVWVGGNFRCSFNELTSLEFSPYYVGGNFDCKFNNISDNYSETYIGGDFYSSLEQDNLIMEKHKVINYKQYQKLIKRKLTINKILNI